MLQQQEATAIVVLKISPFRDHRTKVGKQALKACEEKNSVKHLLVEFSSNSKGSREGNENESGLGRDRRVKEEQRE